MTENFTVGNTLGKITKIATKTAGPIGAAYAVTESNWKCVKCKAENFAKRDRCLRCKTRKPEMQKSITQATHSWREALDPNTLQIYYYNLKTNETTWQRPTEMGPSMYNTGWFGRGNNAHNFLQKLEEDNLKYLGRPAMKQSENLINKSATAYVEGSHEYNIWYNKFSGNSWENSQNFEPADSRVDVALQAGRTLADDANVDGPDSTFNNKYFCIWFARGKCAKGAECSHFHRIPTYKDVGKLEKDMLHDCFGRERHATQRDDMQGVGCFNDPSRTLYVGRIPRSAFFAPTGASDGKGTGASDPSDLRECIYLNFGEFGEVESVNVVWRLAIAFVRFRFRSSCEFAKVAMDRQGLRWKGKILKEVLQVRWAYEDPNPVAKESVKRANADAIVSAIKAAESQVTTSGAEDNTTVKKTIGPVLPDNKRQRLTS